MKGGLANANDRYGHTLFQVKQSGVVKAGNQNGLLGLVAQHCIEEFEKAGKAGFAIFTALNAGGAVGWVNCRDAGALLCEGICCFCNFSGHGSCAVWIDDQNAGWHGLQHPVAGIRAFGSLAPPYAVGDQKESPDDQK